MTGPRTELGGRQTFKVEKQEEKAEKCPGAQEQNQASVTSGALWARHLLFPVFYRPLIRVCVKRRQIQNSRQFKVQDVMRIQTLNFPPPLPVLDSALRPGRLTPSLISAASCPAHRKPRRELGGQEERLRCSSASLPASVPVCPALAVWAGLKLPAGPSSTVRSEPGGLGLWKAPPSPRIPACCLSPWPHTSVSTVIPL